MDNPQSLKLAYISIQIVEARAIRAGVLVTDANTIPLEFRITSVIKPTQLQTTLYGVTLKDYVYTELICLPLLEALKKAPDLLLVQDKTILDLRPSLSYPVTLINRENVGNDSSLSLQVHPDYPGEKANIQTQLAPIIKYRDLLEPFERVKTAITQVHLMNPEGRKELG